MADYSKVVDLHGQPMPGRVLPPGDGGGNYGDMEARIARLESDVEHVKGAVAEIRSDLRDTKADIGAIKTDLAIIKERLSHIPTTNKLVWGGIAHLFVTAALFLAITRALLP